MTEKGSANMPERPEHLPTDLAGTALDRRIEQALTAEPEIHISPGFAAQVALQAQPLMLKAQASRTSQKAVRSFGLRAVWASLPVLLAAMLALAPRAMPAFAGDLHGSAVVSATLEMMLVLEFVGLTLWVSLSERRLV